jgi:hypothetical protein
MHTNPISIPNKTISQQLPENFQKGAAANQFINFNYWINYHNNCFERTIQWAYAICLFKEQSLSSSSSAQVTYNFTQVAVLASNSNPILAQARKQ